MRESEKKDGFDILKAGLFLRTLLIAAIAALTFIFIIKFFMPKKSSYSPRKNIFEKRIIYRICKTEFIK